MQVGVPQQQHLPLDRRGPRPRRAQRTQPVAEAILGVDDHVARRVRVLEALEPGLPAGAERRLRWLLVTPGMHRIHHSQRLGEQQRNYGFFSPWWDRAFGSYQAEPEGGEAALRIGLASEPPGASGLLRLLRLPFRADDAAPASDTMPATCKTPPDSKP